MDYKIYTKICRNKLVIDLYHAYLQKSNPAINKPVGKTYAEIIDFLAEHNILVGTIIDRTYATQSHLSFYPQLVYPDKDSEFEMFSKQYLEKHSKQESALDEAIIDAFEILIKKSDFNNL